MARQQRRFGWWRTFTQRYHVLLIVAPVLFVPGLVLIAIGLLWPAWKDVAWLTGGALLGAGFSAVVTVITGSLAIQEQYAKEANLYRKQEIYGPLHSELKALRERLEAAQQGRLPYPQAITSAGDDSSHGISQAGYPLPTLDWWPQFEKDYRRDNFTEPTQRHLAHLDQLRQRYNTAMEATGEPTGQVLGVYLTKAIKDLISSEAYQRWWNDNNENGRPRQPSTYPANAPNSWFGLLAEALSYNETPDTLGPKMAQSWLHSGVQFSTATLGWLATRQPDRAAQHIQEWARYDSQGRRWDLPWLQAIFAETWANLHDHETYEEVWKAEQKLFHQLGRLERELDDALRYIRDQYEGGEPLV